MTHWADSNEVDAETRTHRPRYIDRVELTGRAVLIKERLIADAELIDEVCLENERSLQHMK